MGSMGLFLTMGNVEFIQICVINRSLSQAIHTSRVNPTPNPHTRLTYIALIKALGFRA